MIKNPLFYLLPLMVATVAGAHESHESHESDGARTNSCSRPGFHEDLQQGIVLTATTNAPAGASGKARIIAVNDNGTNLALLFVKTRGLTNGTYTVTLGDTSGSNTYSLGSLNVATPTNSFECRSHDGHGHGEGDRGEGDRDHSFCGDRPHFDWTNWVGRYSGTNSAFTNLFCGLGATNRFCTNAFHWYTNCLSVGSGSFVLPSGLAQSNVAGISISDSNGVAALTGDFTGVTNSTSIYIETVGLVPGTATNVQGQATLTLTTKNGKTFGSFKLSATGLDPKEKLYLTANDTNTFKVCTSSSGTLKLNHLPHTKPADLQTVVATDVSSNVVFSVGF